MRKKICIYRSRGSLANLQMGSWIVLYAKSVADPADCPKAGQPYLTTNTTHSFMPIRPYSSILTPQVFGQTKIRQIIGILKHVENYLFILDGISIWKNYWYLSVIRHHFRYTTSFSYTTSFQIYGITRYTVRWTVIPQWCRITDKYQIIYFSSMEFPCGKLCGKFLDEISMRKIIYPLWNFLWKIMWKIHVEN